MSIEEPPRSQLNALVLPSNGGRRLLRNRVRYWIYQDMLNQLNSVIVSAEELDSLLNEAENLEAEGCGTEGGGLFLVAQRYRGDHIRALAVYSRLEAFAKLATSAEARSWCLPPLPNGAIPTRSEVIAVAASHPLVQIENSFCFDRSSFFSRALEFAEAEGSS